MTIEYTGAELNGDEKKVVQAMADCLLATKCIAQGSAARIIVKITAPANRDDTGGKQQFRKCILDRMTLGYVYDAMAGVLR